VASTPQKTSQPAPRRLIKLTTVAERLACSIDTVDRFIRAGKLPVVRLPSGRRRVNEEDLDGVIADWTSR
jgi:excisionase family DNA binding protein